MIFDSRSVKAAAPAFRFRAVDLARGGIHLPITASPPVRNRSLQPLTTKPVKYKDTNKYKQKSLMVVVIGNVFLDLLDPLDLLDLLLVARSILD